MSVINNFSSVENKRMLWEFMMKNSFFKDLSDSRSEEIVKKFEDRIGNITLDSTPSQTLIELNKTVIHGIYTDIKNLGMTKHVRFSPNTVTQDPNVTTAERSVIATAGGFSIVN